MWTVYSGVDLVAVAQTGSSTTSAEKDFTVKVSAHPSSINLWMLVLCSWITVEAVIWSVDQFDVVSFMPMTFTVAHKSMCSQRQQLQVDAAGLRSGTQYAFRFQVGSVVSDVGTFR